MGEIDKLAQALAQAQGKFKPVQKTGKNPHLKNQYATLDDIISAVRGPLSEHGLSFVQLLNSDSEGTFLRTILLHESGQQLESNVAIVAAGDHRGVNDLQALGAAITYMKRYSLAAMLGIAADTDTDGEGAAVVLPKRPESPAPKSGGGQPPAPASAVRPFDAEYIRTVCRKKAQWADGPDGPLTKRNPAFPQASEKQARLVVSLMAAALPGMSGEVQNRARHDVLNYLFGIQSTADLRSHEASAVIDWLKAPDSWEPGPYAQAEVATILSQVATDAGQLELAVDAEPPMQEEDAPF